MHVHIVCQEYYTEERILPRMAQYLARGLGWTLSDRYEPCDVVYLSVYFEGAGKSMQPWPDVPAAAYFSHREEQPPNNAKQKCYDAMAKRVQLRVATCERYASPLRRYGPTIVATPPLERDRFVLAGRPQRKRPVVGVSGYVYPNGRKGEDLVRLAVASEVGMRMDWRASGRGWPIPTIRYKWADMPAFYQSLDVLLVTGRVEGIPMPPLEALATGCRVVIPRGVGMLDDIPEIGGIERYEFADKSSLLAALERAAFPTLVPSPRDLRAATAPYTVEGWVADHARAFAETFKGGS
jgi:glycosyltransferase involved in cell wall biosynthesis